MARTLHDLKKIYLESFSGLSKDVWLLALMTLINRSGTMVIVFMTIYLTETLSWSKIDAGIALSIFGLGGVFGSYLGGWLTDRIGYYKTMLGALFFGGLSFLVLMEMQDFWNYCITVFFVSILNDSFRPASMASISAYSKPENHNRSLSLIRLAINLGFALGVGVAGVISEKFGFRWIFIMDTITCILAAVFLKMNLTEKKDYQESKDEKPIELKPEESAYKDHLYLLFAIFVMCNAFAFMQLWNTMPVYFTDIFDISKDNFGYIMFINGFLIFAFEMPIVYLLENKYDKLILVVIGVFMIMLGFLIFNLTSIYQLAIAFSIFMLSFGEILAFPFSNAFALSRSKPGRRGEYMGVYTMAWAFATVAGPVLGMYIAEQYGWTTLWYVLAVIETIACAGFFYVYTRHKKEVELLSIPRKTVEEIVQLEE